MTELESNATACPACGGQTVLVVEKKAGRVKYRNAIIRKCPKHPDMEMNANLSRTEQQLLIYEREDLDGSSIDNEDCPYIRRSINLY